MKIRKFAQQLTLAYLLMASIRHLPGRERKKDISILFQKLGKLCNKLQLAGDVFDDETIQDWIKAKLNEHYAVLERPHPYEVQLYFDL